MDSGPSHETQGLQLLQVASAWPCLLGPLGLWTNFLASFLLCSGAGISEI